MEINILIDKEFKKHVKATWLKSVTRLILHGEAIGNNLEIGLVITSDEKIRELNLKYLDEDRPTDVLSFPMNEGFDNSSIISVDDKIHLGDVIISYPQAVRQAKEHNHSTEREVKILLIHGMLHLIGYDHANSDDAQWMRSYESSRLKITEIKGL